MVQKVCCSSKLNSLASRVGLGGCVGLPQEHRRRGALSSESGMAERLLMLSCGPAGDYRQLRFCGSPRTQNLDLPLAFRSRSQDSYSRSASAIAWSTP